MKRVDSRSRRFVRISCSGEVQSLEARQLLTGIVTVSVSRTGDVSLIGDRNNNVVFAEVQGSNLKLTSQSENGTKFKIGTAAPVSEATLALPASVRSLNVNLGAGNDHLWTSIQSSVSVGRDVVIDMGVGNDEVFLDLMQAGLTIGQDLRVELGSGDDLGYIGAFGNGTLRVGRDLIVNSGAGNDDLGISDINLLDTVDNPGDVFLLPNNTAQANSQAIRAGRDLKVDMGTGNDLLGIIGAEAVRDAELNSGAGLDTVGVSNLRTGRNLRFINGEKHALHNLKVVGTLYGRTSAGADEVAVQNIDVGRLDVNLGAGNDKLVVGDNVIVRSGGVIDGAAGTNKVFIAGAAPSATVLRLSPTLGQTDAELLVDAILTDVLAFLID